MHLGLNDRPSVPHILYQAIGTLFPWQSSRWPPCLVPLYLPGPKRRNPRYAWLSEAKVSHSHKMWTEVSSSVPNFIHMGSLHSPMICTCLLKVLCPVSRPITTLDCVLLKGSFHHSLNHTEITNKMQPCTRIYYYNVYQLLNMLRAHTAHHQELKNCNCSLWFYIRLWLPAAVKAERELQLQFPLSLDAAGTHRLIGPSGHYMYHI